MVCVQARRLHFDAIRIEQLDLEVDVVEIVSCVVRDGCLAREGRVLFGKLKVYRACQRFYCRLLVIVALHLLAMADQLI